MRTVTSLHQAVRDDIHNLVTFRALPIPGLEDLNPFLFLNHHGPQNYETNNSGLPFGPHPHRGFETVTFILEGDIAHKDTAGNESVIHAGGVQWMTAGSGLIHSEVSSSDFKKTGGPLEILQLWVNLPARLKMTKPWYLGLQKKNIPIYERDSGRLSVQLISGKWEDNLGPVPTLHPVTTMMVSMREESAYEFSIPEERIFFYVISGFVTVNGKEVGMRETVTFDQSGDLISVKAEMGARILLCHARLLEEPIASYGPFVMNTMDEIQQAIKDFQSGKIS